jgi:arginine-tRNA-protein transferase
MIEFATEDDLKEATYFHLSPEEMDVLLADAWRHNGEHFYRSKLDIYQEKWVKVVPLRINLAKFSFSKHHKKLLHRQRFTTVEYQAIEIDEYRIVMFHVHCIRYKESLPESLYDFLGNQPGVVPCATLECALYDEEEELYACSYFDISANAISSIYAMFDLNYSKRSPGLHTLLAEILYAMEHQKQYVYLGYAYDVPSYYDYKKQFNGLECYDWEGNWVDYISPATT